MYRQWILSVAAALALAACAVTSGYQASYKAAEGAPPAAEIQPLQPGQPVEIRNLDDLAAGLDELRAEGYVVIGYAQFAGKLEGDEGIIAAAAEHGATLVLKSTLLEGRAAEYRRVYDRYAGMVYQPVEKVQVDEKGEGASSDGDSSAVEVYRQTAIFLARRR